MAIEVQGFKTRFGDEYEKAYARIIELRINYAQNYADVIIGTYRSELDRKLGNAPVLVETKSIDGDNFTEFFKEISVDKIDAKINPIADIYNDLTLKDGKYKGGLKLYDEKLKEDGERKEVGKEEIIADEKAAAEKNYEKQAALDKAGIL
tara:strand:+ start:119 stop:568 length:450 start_codon:yes stop_codon:yes gene_type:complete